MSTPPHPSGDHAPNDHAEDYRIALAGQAQAALPEASVWVAANAGSGKTKVLIDRVARLLLRGAKPDSILCVTYTKAAASEMQDRLFKRLGEWCVTPPARLRAQLAELEGRPAESFSESEIGDARELFAQALETPGGLRIETIHAFCGRVLRRFPLEAGVAPGFHELDDDDAGELWERAFRALGRRVGAGDKTLIAAARLVAEFGGKGLQTLRLLDSRRADIAAFIARHGGPKRPVEGATEALRLILKSGALPLDAMLERAMGADLPHQALQALLGALPRVKPSDANLAETLEVVLSPAPAADRYAAYRALAFTDKGESRKTNGYTTDAVKLAPSVADLFQIKDIPQGVEIQRILQLDADLNARAMFERSAALLQLAHVLFADFAHAKRSRAGLDFDDLIERVKRLLTLHAAAEWVLWKLDGGVAHVLLDEAQDTSPAQWDILRKLTDDLFSGHGAERPRERTLFVVGDRKQSIYSFQGADPERFIAIGQEFVARADAASVTWTSPSLQMSFRSSPEILRFVDETFLTSAFDGGDPFSVTPPVEADLPRHTAKRWRQPGSVELWPLEPKAEEPEPQAWDAPRIALRQTSPKVQLANRIAAFIKREIATGAAVWDGDIQRACRPGDFLILVRQRMGGLFDAILQALKKEGLPVAGADRLQLLDSLAVQDLLNLARFVLCPEDDLVLAEIIKGPFGATGAADTIDFLGEDDLFTLAHGRTSSLWERMHASTDPRHAGPRAFLADALARRGQPAFEFLAHALERGLHLPRPGWELILQRFGGPAREPVTALLDRAAAFDADQPASLESFVASIEALGGEVKRELSGAQDEIRVMTVHGAKGLEAPIVILPDTVSAHRGDKDGVFVTREGAPIWAGPKSGDTPVSAPLRLDVEARALREHRRLLYVALTRARDRLVVCGAHAGKAGGAGYAATSWYAACLGAMTRLKDSGAAAEAGAEDAPILRLGPPPATLGPDPTAFDAPVAPAWAFALAPSETGVARILAPSSLGPGEPPPLAPFGPDRSLRMRRGRLIHKLFEALPDLPLRSRRKAAREFLKRQRELTPAQRDEMLDATFRVLENPDFAHVFVQGGIAEAPVIGPSGADILNGRIDRLVVTDQDILLVDFKTDRPAPASRADVGPAYLAQMDAYSRILSEAWPGRAVRRVLVWTDGPLLMEV